MTRKYEYKIGLDNCIYMIWSNPYDCSDFYDKYKFDFYGIACFGGYENSIVVCEIWGQ